jgi:structural maintenance of chromosome 1
VLVSDLFQLTSSISTTGQSTYYLNNRAVQWTAYNAQLEQFNILVKAKNFLVFQGDVEGVASQDSKALAKLIDRISG